jgi:hypothetical protein
MAEGSPTTFTTLDRQAPGLVAFAAAKATTAPQRPKVDRAALDFVKGHVFDPADFVIRTDGVCRLNPEMARMVVARISTRDGLRLAGPEST